jgi:putative transcriptional regulator
MDKSGTLRRKGVVVKPPRGRALDDAEALAAAKVDPENPPLSKKRMSAMTRTPQVKVLRRALGLTQQEFAARYQIPLGTLRDWEQGRAIPDLPTRAYLKVIARDPKAVAKALERG